MFSIQLGSPIFKQTLESNDTEMAQLQKMAEFRDRVFKNCSEILLGRLIQKVIELSPHLEDNINSRYPNPSENLAY